jgi:hypothetical protein
MSMNATLHGRAYHVGEEIDGDSCELIDVENGEVITVNYGEDTLNIDCTDDEFAACTNVRWSAARAGNITPQARATHDSGTAPAGRWATYDAIEIATVGYDTEQPCATGTEYVERMDGIDPEGYEFRAHSIYGHLKTGGVECLADCWERDAAQQLGTALAQQLGVPVYDYTIEMAKGGDR